MINLNKTIVRLFGSCLLCSAFTTVNCNGDLSSSFYNCLTTYTEQDAGHSTRACYSDEDCHGYISGRYDEGRTLANSYSEIVSWKEQGIEGNKSFEVMDKEDGDYYDNSDYACPLWCSHGKGNDLTYDDWHDSIYIRGLEAIGPYAVGSSQNLKKIRFASVPVAIDDDAFTQVNGLEEIVFQDKQDNHGLPYFISPLAFNYCTANIKTTQPLWNTGGIRNIKFYDKELGSFNMYTKGEKSPHGFEGRLKELALKNKPEAAATLNGKSKGLYDNLDSWKDDNPSYTLYNFLKTNRIKVQRTGDGGKTFTTTEATHLYNYIDGNNTPVLEWTIDEDENKEDLYWDEYASEWEDNDDESQDESKKGGGLGQIGSTFLGSNDLDISDKPTSYENESEELEDTGEMSLEPLKESEDSQNNSLGQTTNLEQSSNTSLQEESSESNFGGTSIKQYSSEKQTSNKAGSSSASASTKTGYSTDMNLLFPMTLSGGFSLLLKKKKDD